MAKTPKVKNIMNADDIIQDILFRLERLEISNQLTSQDYPNNKALEHLESKGKIKHDL
jgi:hypothetical protein